MDDDCSVDIGQFDIGVDLVIRGSRRGASGVRKAPSQYP